MDILRAGGIQYNWNSTSTRIDGQPYKGVRSIDWGEKLDVETVYSQTQDGRPIGSTGGQYSVESFTLKMLTEYADQLTTYLAFAAPGFPPGNRGLPGNIGETQFLFQFTATEPLQIGATPIILNASPCRIIGMKNTVEQGTAALITEFTLWSQGITVNGKSLYKQALPSL